MTSARKFTTSKSAFYILLIIMLPFTPSLKAQTIEIEIKGSAGKAYLYALSGEKSVLRDSIPAISNGKYIFNLDTIQYSRGLYRISSGKNKPVSFLYDYEEVRIKTHPDSPLDSLQVLSSESNKQYYAFIRLNKSFKEKTELLQLILARYPKDDEYFTITTQKVKQLQNEYIRFVNDIQTDHPGSFIARYSQSAQLAVIDYSLPLDKQLIWLKSHALDQVDFKDEGLVHSDVFTNKSIEYLTLYSNPQLPKELLEKEFRIAVDTILGKAKINLAVYQHITEYLIDGFKKFGFDKIIEYIIENYVIKDGLCLDQTTENSVQRRLEQSRSLPVGAVAPNIVLSDPDGMEIDLSKLNNEKSLIVFYAGWCPHCVELIPRLHELCVRQPVKSVEIIAISLDASKSDWLSYLGKQKLTWINGFAENGWSSKPALDYYIYATPTLFLLDKGKKILLKASTIEEVSPYFR